MTCGVSLRVTVLRYTDDVGNYKNLCIRNNTLSCRDAPSQTGTMSKRREIVEDR